VLGHDIRAEAGRDTCSCTDVTVRSTSNASRYCAGSSSRNGVLTPVPGVVDKHVQAADGIRELAIRDRVRTLTRPSMARAREPSESYQLEPGV
jgi:hypothetical protein